MLPNIIFEVIKHLPGQHDQKKHSSRVGRPADYSKLPKKVQKKLLLVGAQSSFIKRTLFKYMQIVSLKHHKGKDMGNYIVAAYQKNKPYGGEYTLISLNPDSLGEVVFHNTDYARYKATPVDASPLFSNTDPSFEEQHRQSYSQAERDYLGHFLAAGKAAPRKRIFETLEQDAKQNLLKFLEGMGLVNGYAFAIRDKTGLILSASSNNDATQDLQSVSLQVSTQRNLPTIDFSVSITDTNSDGNRLARLGVITDELEKMASVARSVAKKPAVVSYWNADREMLLPLLSKRFGLDAHTVRSVSESYLKDPNLKMKLVDLFNEQLRKRGVDVDAAVILHKVTQQLTKRVQDLQSSEDILTLDDLNAIDILAVDHSRTVQPNIITISKQIE